jgi:hypothetical protein
MTDIMGLILMSSIGISMILLAAFPIVLLLKLEKNK